MNVIGLDNKISNQVSCCKRYNRTVKRNILVFDFVVYIYIFPILASVITGFWDYVDVIVTCLAIRSSRHFDGK